MGNLQPIIDAILADGEKKAAAVRVAADEKITHIREEFERENAKTRAEFEKNIEKETEQMYSAQDAERTQLMKTARLNARTAAVKTALKDARDKIIGMNTDEYFAFLKRVYDKIGQTGGTVYLNDRDGKCADKSIFAGSVVSDKPADISGGFIMDCGKISYDCSIEGIFEERRSELYDIAGEILSSETT